MAQGFLPVTKKELLETGVSQPDFVYVVGDAYVDHPSFGAAIMIPWWHIIPLPSENAAKILIPPAEKPDFVQTVP